MDKLKIEEAINLVVTINIKEKKKFISCSQAFSIAEKLNVAPGEIGKECNKIGVKIMKCQLGCF